MLIVHHSDLDGRCSGAIVYRYVTETNWGHDDIKLEEMDYEKEFPIDKVKENEYVYIVDFCVEDDKVVDQLLKRTKNIVWIDHHKTSLQIKKMEHIDGIRSVETAACSLCWKYFYKTDPPPAVLLIADMDAWKWEFGFETKNFTTGLLPYPQDPKSNTWDRLFQDDKEFIEQIKKEGSICVRFRDWVCKDYRESYGFETEFEGHKCYACGFYNFGSLVFGDLMQKYDVCLSFEFNGEKWMIGLYSTKIDVSEIAQKYGGGGHKGAAGFVYDKLPFKKV
jgi:oligoribonuclease NrnB/cAMP/cGMP phosphodiesterase (DHH superfamily)